MSSLAPLLALTLWLASLGLPGANAEVPTTRLIVQGQSVEAVRQLVREVGGTVTHELGIIKAVGAELTARQIEILETSGTVRLFADRSLDTSSTGCAADGGGTRIIDDRKLFWTITNTGSEAITLGRIDVRWPEVQRQSQEDQVRRRRLLQDRDRAPRADGDLGLERRRRPPPDRRR